MNLLFIGCGNMGYSIYSALENNILFSKIFIVDPNFSSKVGSTTITYKNLSEVNFENIDYVILAIKPNHLGEILTKYSSFLKSKIIISIVASKSISSIESSLGSEVKIARIMPNMAAQYKSSISLLCYNKNLMNSDISFVKSIAASFGDFEIVEEQNFAKYTIFSSCLPAFIYLFVSKFSDQNDSTTNRLIKGALASAAALSTNNKNKTFNDLITSIASKGGITESGINYLSSIFDDKSIENTVEICIKKSKEIE